MTDDSRITFKISGQEFTIRATPEIAPQIDKAVKLVEEIIGIYQQAGERDVLRLYLMSAFHLAFELVSFKDHDVTPEELSKIKASIENLKIKVLNACKADVSKRDPNSPS